uniref:Uncharacterized protein n=1 Tax=Anguilla anguilla TaxID=7936 RepID=A0A0E9X567_ANGAN
MYRKHILCTSRRVAFTGKCIFVFNLFKIAIPLTESLPPHLSSGDNDCLYVLLRLLRVFSLSSALGALLCVSCSEVSCSGSECWSIICSCFSCYLFYSFPHKQTILRMKTSSVQYK